uniref:Uncharacterized protein n=1 Tax=Scophthalmus maximus TaxID=52904 RepID=A0A8D2ZPE1_SCOMX
MSASAAVKPPFFSSHLWPLVTQQLQKAVTGKSFGDKDFRSALENGILLCELLSAIKPGLVKKINRLPTPIAGLDNLSVFLRGCEELGLRGSQLFDPGDLQDTSTRANLKDSDCNRKLKNVLNTVFWLGKAASGCASFGGPTLNLKEFEGLLSQMKMEDIVSLLTSHGVRDSGYDCWDSERSESLSPPRHTRDNSLDSLDSFGSRSQHSPSPDVVNRGNSDGRGSDSEADGPGRKPDVRKDDMLARRTASSEARSSIPFNQFLPNRTNASCYIPTPRRKPHPGTCVSGLSGEKLWRSMSLGDMLNEEEVGYLPPLSQSRHERMQEQYNSFQEEEDPWRNDLTRWKNRRRSASQELIKKEEERKRIEKSMKEQGGDGNKRKSIKTYKEIVEDKERREVELCEAYRNAATPEEAAMVLQRYALRFTISDATLDSLKLPRSNAKPKSDLSQVDKEHEPSSAVNDSPETSEPPPLPLLAAKPYCQPRSTPSGHKSVKVRAGYQSVIPIETPMLNLAKRVNHWVWDPNEERKRLESWQQEQERLLQEQYQREQEKLKKEWEKAQLEVEEEERKHNEEERRILEETVTPLNPTGLLNQQLGKTETISSAPEKSDVPLQQNGQRVSAGNEDQHASKLHFFQGEIRAETVGAQCVSGKRLCSSCSQPLGKGAAMIIDTLGLFFHVQCFKCGVCEGQLGDATAGTDVRIRNGLLSCHECYMASRGRGQPTTL